ncbi:MAG: PIG-L family deacetylase [Pseudomonadota bacterium]|nr:PIG-L family deacetylase [Pseudomonadota bacterium]
MKNILFVIPHPDDEVVGSCIIIKRLLMKKKNIFIFFTSNGVISKDSMWIWKRRAYNKLLKIRKIEMGKCLEEIGVKKFFFQNIPTRTLKDNIFKTYNKIQRIVKKRKIDNIFCPAYEGGHQDHDVANFICSKFKNDCVVNEFPEYNFFHKKINSNTFFYKCKKQRTIFLTNHEKSFKKKCLNIYDSERENLNYVKFEKEMYRPIFNYDYTKPPYIGTLFYRRFRFFSWHPRVDGDAPEIICEKIQNSNIFKLL